MAYRSDVAIRIATTAEGMQRVKDDIKANWDADLLRDGDMKSNEWFYEITFHWDWIKWNTELEDVASIMHWLWHAEVQDPDNSDEENDKIDIVGWQFIRLGEELGDVEEDCVGEIANYMSVIQYIDFGD